MLHAGNHCRRRLTAPFRSGPLGELQTHPIRVSPHDNAALGHMIECQVKFSRQRSRFGQQQTNAGG